VPTVEYNDPDFSKRYTLTTATADPVAAGREVTAYAWNREYAYPGVPLTRYTVTDPHIISMADRFARVVG
jgi:hypothetical protein